MAATTTFVGNGVSAHEYMWSFVVCTFPFTNDHNEIVFLKASHFPCFMTLLAAEVFQA